MHFNYKHFVIPVYKRTKRRISQRFTLIGSLTCILVFTTNKTFLKKKIVYFFEKLQIYFFIFKNLEHPTLYFGRPIIYTSFHVKKLVVT